MNEHKCCLCHKTDNLIEIADVVIIECVGMTQAEGNMVVSSYTDRQALEILCCQECLNAEKTNFTADLKKKEQRVDVLQER